MGTLTLPSWGNDDVHTPGTYILKVYLPDARRIRVGQLGECLFSAGYYLYVGSALGSLWGRLRRHLQSAKRPHWHIDYLLEYATLAEVWYILSPKRLECAWASALARIEGTIPFSAPFGASDCRCWTHLFYAPIAPEVREVAPALPYGEDICSLKVFANGSLLAMSGVSPESAR